MSYSGIFKIIANDGKADRMIMASQLLKKRLDDIICQKKAAGMSPEQAIPSLLDIERTHVLFVHAHFKPFAAIGYEYLKVQGSKSITFGQECQFSIPQAGDFFSDMVINVQLAQTQATAGVVPPLPAYIGAVNQSTAAGVAVSGTNNTVSLVYTKYTQEYTDIQGNVLVPGAAISNYVRYCEYPGERIMNTVKFDVNNNPLDSYNNVSYVFWRKFRIIPSKLVGWKRMVGQEVEQDAWSDLRAINGASMYGSAVTGLKDVNGNAVLGAPVAASDTSRQVFKVLNGPQTAKAVQPQLNMWVPLLFWFNLDTRLAVPSVSIPYGQRFITITTEPQSSLLFTAPGNLYYRVTTEQITNSTGTIAGVSITDVQRYQTAVPVLANGSNIDTTQQILAFDLYLNSIYVAPEIHDIYIQKIAFTLIRVHRIQSQSVSLPTDRILLSLFKWPIEFFFVGIRPAQNTAATYADQYRDWHRFTALTNNYIDVVANASGAVSIDNTTAVDSTTGWKVFNSQYSAQRTTYPTTQDTIDTLLVEAQGVTLYQQYATAFYRDYITYNYGGPTLMTPEDKGVLMVNFCLYPTQYQPSGHINTSRVREFYIQYTSSYVSTTNLGNLLTEASAINFLLITDGSAVIRYTT